jgi:TPP-dependent pyruvate/acetoin dehydrogenase alpha subunit
VTTATGTAIAGTTATVAATVTAVATAAGTTITGATAAAMTATTAAAISGIRAGESTDLIRHQHRRCRNHRTDGQRQHTFSEQHDAPPLGLATS